MGTTSSTHRVTSQDRAILDLKLQRDKLQRYQRKVSVVLEREHALAREFLSRGDKPRALLALRRRKYQSTLLSQTDRQLETLEQLTTSIEFALIEKDVLYGLRQGNTVLGQIRKEMTLESVEKLMDETAEGIRYQNEISQMLAGVMSNADEDEVEDELEQMEREIKAKLEVPPSEEPVAVVPEMPMAPTKTLEATEEEKAQRARERARARKAALQRTTVAAEEPMLA